MKCCSSKWSSIYTLHETLHKNMDNMQNFNHTDYSC